MLKLIAVGTKCIEAQGKKLRGIKLTGRSMMLEAWVV